MGTRWPETCWATYKGEINIILKVTSSWYLYPHWTTMHGQTYIRQNIQHDMEQNQRQCNWSWFYITWNQLTSCNGHDVLSKTWEQMSMLWKQFIYIPVIRIFRILNCFCQTLCNSLQVIQFLIPESVRSLQRAADRPQCFHIGDNVQNYGLRNNRLFPCYKHNKSL